MSGDITERFRVTFKKKDDGTLEDGQEEFLDEYVNAGTEGLERDARQKLVKLIKDEKVEMIKISGLGETTVDNASQFFTPENANTVVAKYVKGQDNKEVVVQVHSKEDDGNKVTNEIMNNMTCNNTVHVQDLIQYIKTNAPANNSMYVTIDPELQSSKQIKEDTLNIIGNDGSNIKKIEVIPNDINMEDPFYKGEENKDFNYLVYHGDGNIVSDLVGRCLMIGIPHTDRDTDAYSRRTQHRVVFGFVVAFYDKNDELIKQVMQQSKKVRAFRNKRESSKDSLYGVLYYDPPRTAEPGGPLVFVNDINKDKSSSVTHVSSNQTNPRWKNLPAKNPLTGEDCQDWMDQDDKPHGKQKELDGSPFMTMINEIKTKMLQIMDSESNNKIPKVSNLEMKFGIFSLARKHIAGFGREYIGLPYTILGSPYGIVSDKGGKTEGWKLHKGRIVFHRSLATDKNHLTMLVTQYVENPMQINHFFERIYTNKDELSTFYAGMKLCFLEYFIRNILMRRTPRVLISAERRTMNILMREWKDQSEPNGELNINEHITWKDQKNTSQYGLRYVGGGQGKTKKKLPLTYKKTINKDKRKTKIKRKRKTKGNTNI